MKKYDFDCIIDRHDTGAVKYEGLDAMFGRHDVTALWIADLDFAVCPEIVEALRHRLCHPVLGYSAAPDSYWQSIIDWQRRRHGFDLKREHLAFVPGVVRGVAYAVTYFTQPGDKIVIQPPVYYPFRQVIEGNGRNTVENPLHFDGNSYTMDLDHLAEVIEHEHPRMMILCNPHNPIGIQWDKETLRAVAAMCRRAGVIVVSDEIHGDMMLGGRRHLPFASVSDDARAISVTVAAPSKTFNIPGLVSSWIAVLDDKLRDGFYKWLEVNQFSLPIMFAVIGAEAAYNNGEQWLEQMLEYVQANVDFTADYVSTHIPGVHVIKPQASFLVWLDCRSLGLTQDELMHLMIDKAHLALNDGSLFGSQGRGFLRLNVGTTRHVLEDALDHVRLAVESLNNVKA